MREFRPYGSVRGARSNARPYRDPPAYGQNVFNLGDDHSPDAVLDGVSVRMEETDLGQLQQPAWLASLAREGRNLAPVAAGPGSLFANLPAKQEPSGEYLLLRCDLVLDHL